MSVSLTRFASLVAMARPCTDSARPYDRSERKPCEVSCESALRIRSVIMMTARWASLSSMDRLGCSKPARTWRLSADLDLGPGRSKLRDSIVCDVLAGVDVERS